MAGFDFFRTAGGRYSPRTTNAALRAFDARVLPVEGYLYTATSVRPLDEAPYDIDYIERVLGRENLDRESNLLLVKILRHLLVSPEQEVALFAAEGMNLIENRYAKKIEALREQLSDPPEEDHLRELSALYAELSALYLPGSSLRGFYLREAYRLLATLRDRTALDTGDTVRLTRVLIDLGLFDQAAAVLRDQPAEARGRLLLLEAEIEFKRRHYARVWEICRELEATGDAIDPDERSVIDYWLGNDGS